MKAIVEKFEEKVKEKEEKPKEKPKEKEKEKEKEIEKEKEKEKEKLVVVVKQEEEPPTSVSPAPSVKKEKAKKKPPETKKKKEDVEVKKEIIVAKGAHSGPIIPEDIPIEVDDRLKVYYRGSSDYEAKVLEVSAQDGKAIYRVHYKGWNARYDEWIHRESIAENLTKDEPKKKSGSAASKSSTPSTSAGSSSNLTTPTSKNATKRGRNRADTTASSRSTTPLSNTSGKGKPAQKRITRGAPPNKSSRRTSLNDDNSSESDEPIKKPNGKDDKKEEGKSSRIQKSASSDLNETRSEFKSAKEVKGEKTLEASGDGGSKSDDEKSTKSSIKSTKSPFAAKTKLKVVQRDSSRSSFHSSDSDSSHSVPSDVPNSSKSAYTSENESNGPEKLPVKPDAKKSSFRFDDDTSDGKTSGATSFFDKNEAKPTDASIFTSKKPNIFQDKKMTQQRVLGTPGDSKVGRFSQLEKSLTKDTGKGKSKEVKGEEKPAESDVYEFKDTEEMTPAASTSKKQEPPVEGLTKKQQLAQQRKQARLLQKETQESAGSPMEDIESMIKTSIVQSNKKRKKSPSKEEKSQSMIVARTPVNPAATTGGWTPVAEPFASKSGSHTPKQRSESTFDVLRKSPNFNMNVGEEIVKPTPMQRGPVKVLFGPEMDTHELLKPIMVPSNDDEKPELEAFKKILEPSFDILPKQEKSGSIVDKLLKSMKEGESSHQSEVTLKKEEPKVDPYAFKVKSPVATVGGKKPLLVSPELKVEDKQKGNVELQGIIHKLECAIQRSATPLNIGSSESSHFAAVKKQADDSDTDSDPRLVIEDDVESNEKKKTMGVLESMMMQEEVPFKEEKKSESGEQQSETMSLLLCEETIPGSPAPVQLSEIGRSPSSTGFVHPPSMPSQSSNTNYKYQGNITTALLHQQYQSSASHQTNLKQIPMDIEGEVEAATGDILRDKLKSERGSATSSGNNTNNNSDNIDSNDDQSDNEKNGEIYSFDFELILISFDYSE